LVFVLSFIIDLVDLKSDLKSSLGLFFVIQFWQQYLFFELSGLLQYWHWLLIFIVVIGFVVRFINLKVMC
jgi:hypothetical protein